MQSIGAKLDTIVLFLTFYVIPIMQSIGAKLDTIVLFLTFYVIETKVLLIRQLRIYIFVMQNKNYSQ